MGSSTSDDDGARVGDCTTTGASGNKDSQIPPDQGFCSYILMGWLIDNNVGPFFLGSRLDPESGMTSTVSSPRCMSPTVLWSLGDLAPLEGFPLPRLLSWCGPRDFIWP